MASSAHRHDVAYLGEIFDPQVAPAELIDINEEVAKWVANGLTKQIDETVEITPSQFEFVAATIEKIVNETMAVFETEEATTPGAEAWSTDVTFDNGLSTDDFLGQKIVMSNPWYPDDFRLHAKRTDAQTYNNIRCNIYANPTGSNRDVVATADAELDIDSWTFNTYETKAVTFTGGNRPLLPAGTYAIGFHRLAGTNWTFVVQRSGNSPADDTAYVAVQKNPDASGSWVELSSGREIAMELDWTEVTTQSSTIVVLANQILKFVNTTVNIDEFVEMTPGLVREVAETLHIDDLAQFIASSAKVIDENVNINEFVVDPVQAFIRIIGENIDVTEFIQKSEGFIKQVDETLHITELIQQIKGLKQLINEDIHIDDSISDPPQMIVRLVSEIEGILDGLSKGGDLSKTVGEIVNITENRIRGFRKLINEQIHIDDTMTSANRILPAIRKVVTEGLVVIDDSIVSKVKEGKNVIRKKVNTFIRQKTGRSRSKGYDKGV